MWAQHKGRGRRAGTGTHVVVLVSGLNVAKGFMRFWAWEYWVTTSWGGGGWWEGEWGGGWRHNSEEM
jgi:hypothetical protein